MVDEVRNGVKSRMIDDVKKKVNKVSKVEKWMAA